MKIAKSPLARACLKLAGLLCIFLGILGIPLPGLPTTPFFILAAYCFSRSSETWYKKVIQHPKFGPPVKDYLDGKGIPRRIKVIAMIFMWIFLCISFVTVPKDYLKLIIIVSGIYASWFILREPDAPDQ